MSLTKEEKEEIIAAKKKKKMSLPILVMESDLYDWNPGARFLLLVIALGRRTNPDAKIPAACPMTAIEALGWCDMAEWRLALRVGKSESQIQRDITMFEENGVINVKRWRDAKGKMHNMYWVDEAVIVEHKRPSQTSDVKRPSRYKTEHKPKPHKGLFSKKHQPSNVAPEIAEMDEVE